MFKRISALLLTLLLVTSLCLPSFSASADWGDGTWGVSGEVSQSTQSQSGSWGMPSNNRFQGTFKWNETPAQSSRPTPSPKPVQDASGSEDAAPVSGQVSVEGDSSVRYPSVPDPEPDPDLPSIEEKTGVPFMRMDGNGYVFFPGEAKLLVNELLKFNYGANHVELRPGSDEYVEGVYHAAMDQDGNYEIALLSPGESTFNFDWAIQSDATFDVTVVGAGGGGGSGGDCGSSGQHAYSNGGGGDGGNVVTATGLSVSNYTSPVTATVGAGGAPGGYWAYAFCSPSSCECVCDSVPQVVSGRTCTCPHMDRDAYRPGSTGGQSVFGSYTAYGGTGGSSRNDNVQNGSNGSNYGDITILGQSYHVGYGGGGGSASGDWSDVNHPSNNNMNHSYTASAYNGYVVEGYGNGGCGSGTFAYYNGCGVGFNYGSYSNSNVTEEGSWGGSAGLQGIIYLRGKQPLKGIVEINKIVYPLGYDRDGFEFELIKVDGTTETSIGVVSTDTNGYARFVGLDPGQYICRELDRDGYIIDEPQQFTLAASEVKTLQFENTSLSRIDIKKETDDYPAKTDLSGFQFNIYSVDGSTEHYLETVTTDASGEAHSSWYPLGGNYMVEEVNNNAAMQWYNENTLRIPVSLDFRYNMVSYTNTSFKLNASLKKEDLNLGSEAQGDGTLEGARYALLYYEMVGGVETEHIVDYATSDANGTIAFPYAASAYRDYYYREVEAPTGYQLDETAYPLSKTGSGNTYTGYNVVKDTVQMAPILISKKDSDAYFQSVTPFSGDGYVYGSESQGDADINTGVFSIYYDESNVNNHISVNGTTYGKGDLVTTVASNSWSIPLPYGTYKVIETTPPEGYKPNSTPVILNNYSSSPAIAEFTNDVETTTLQILKASSLPDVNVNFTDFRIVITNLSEHPIRYRDPTLSYGAGYGVLSNWFSYNGSYYLNPGGQLAFWCRPASGHNPTIELPVGTYKIHEDHYPTESYWNNRGTDVVPDFTIRNYGEDVTDPLDLQMKIYNEPDFGYSNSGDIVIKKTADANLPAEALDDEFTIYVNTNYGCTVQIQRNGAADGSMTIPGTVTMKAGDTVKLSGLPLYYWRTGYSPNIGHFETWDYTEFQVTEWTPLPDGWEYVSGGTGWLQTRRNLNGITPHGELIDAHSGEILETWERTDAVYEIVNHYTNSLPDTFNLTVTKETAGLMADTDKLFDFSVVLTNDATDTPYTEAVAPTGTMHDWAGADGSYTFKLKNGESMSLTLPEGVSYIISESDDADYEESVNNVPGRQVSGVISETSGNVTYAFKNTRDGANIVVDKTIAGDSADMADRFTYTLTMKGQDNTAPYEGTVTPSGNVTGWTNTGAGTYTFTLGHGESITIPLPDGTNYMVSEDPNGYTCTVNNADGTSASGVISHTDGDAEYSFKNTKNGASVTVSKTVEGNFADPDEKFLFTATFTRNSSPYTGTISPAGDVTEWTNTANGVYTFKLGDGESISMSLPAGVAYSFVENSNGYVCKVNDAAGNTASGTIVSGTDRTFAFKNTKNGSHLIVSKQLAGNFRNLNDVFNFTLTLKDASDNAYDGEVTPEGDVHDWSSTGTGVYVFKLGHGEEISIELPDGIKYTVSEQAKDYKPSVDGAAGSSANGTVSSAGGDKEHVFVNTKNGTVPTGISSGNGVGIVFCAVAVVSAMAAAGAVIVKKRKNKV